MNVAALLQDAFSCNISLVSAFVPVLLVTHAAEGGEAFRLVPPGISDVSSPQSLTRFMEKHVLNKRTKPFRSNDGRGDGLYNITVMATFCAARCLGGS